MSNHAVSVRLAVTAPAAHAKLARALVDFGVQVRMGQKAAAQGAATPVVGEVLVGGRPQGLFGGKHRSHTTAWVVFTDVVRTAILYQPVDVAVQRMTDLIDQARLLPGASADRRRALANADQVAGRSGARIYTAADRRATTAQDAVADADAGEEVAVLQDLVAAYLDLRNSTPLSVTHDTDRAGGHGEGTARGALVDDTEDDEEPAADTRNEAAAALADAERTPARMAPDVARRAMWQLLDIAAVRHILDTEPPTARAYTTVPGNVAGEGPARRLVETVAQHLITVRQAYPDQFARADMGADDSIRGVLGGAADAPYGNGGTVLTGIRAWLDGASPVGAPAGAQGVTVPASAPRGTAQIVLEDDDGTPTVAALRLGNRPQGILGEAEGAHLTAFGLVVEGLKREVEGAPLDDVGRRVAGLIQQARGLATAGRADALLGHAADRFAAADANATTALQALAGSGPVDPAYVARVQDLIVAYLWLRNTLPLAAVSEGGVPAGKAEGRMLALLRDAEDGYGGAGMRPDDDEVLDALWGLLDSAALRSVVETDSFFGSPGIRGRNVQRELHRRAGDIVKTHIATAAQAFPQCVAATGMRTKSVVQEFLVGDLPRHNQRATGDDNEALALTVDTLDAIAIAHYVIDGRFPAPRTPPPGRAPIGGGRTRRTSQAPKRFRDDNFEGEEAFPDQEREMVEEEANIVRRPPKKKARTTAN